MGWSVDNSTSAELAAQEALKQALRAETGADYIDGKQPLIEEFTGEQTNLQTQLNDLVLQSGTDIAEVVQARGGEVTLHSRLEKTTALLAETGQGLSFAQSKNIINNPTQKFRSVDVVQGYVYAGSGTNLYRSSDVDGQFELVKTFTSGSIGGIRDTGDGELLIVKGNDLYKSNGWSVNINTATWDIVLTTGGRIAQFGFATDPISGWCLVSNYINGDMTQSRWAWLSKDRGETWEVVFDMAIVHPTADQAHAHMHLCVIDTYVSTTTPRLWLSYHKTDADPTVAVDPIRRIIYSDNGGATWEILSDNFIQPVIGIPTERGMVFDTDRTPAELYIAERTPNPADMELELLYQIRADVAQVGWATKAVSGANGSAHIVFRSSVTKQPGRIISTDGYRAIETLAIPFATDTDTVDFVDLVVHKGKMRGVYYQTVSGGGIENNFISDEPKRGVQTQPNVSGASGGTAGVLGIAIGESSSSENGQRGMAIGTLANASEQSVSVGYASISKQYGVSVGNQSVSDINGVAIGDLAVSNGGVSLGRSSVSENQSTAVGYSADALSTETTAVGEFARATGTQSTSLGATANASGANAIAIGRASTASQSSSIAIGRASQSTHAGSIALGSSTVTTADNQVAFGAKHMEVKVAAPPTAPAINTARHFFRLNTNGNIEWCVRFPTGEFQIVASQEGVKSNNNYVTNLRPSATAVGIGSQIFDTTLKKPLWSNGTAWVDATGVVV